MRIGAFLLATFLILLLSSGLTSAGVLSLGGENFNPDINGYNYDNSWVHGGAFIVSGDGHLVAPVNLPQGAIVTGFKAFFYNNISRSHSSKLSVLFSGLNLSTAGYFHIAGVNSDGISEYGSKIASNVLQTQIDNNNVSYNIRVGCQAWQGENLMIIGVIITFKLPPNIPSIPLGPTSGTPGTSYSYSTSTTDPDGNRVNYTFNWGDGTTSVTNLTDSGKGANATHKWNNIGKYLVKARATDDKGVSSEWSSPLAVTISNPTPNTPSTPLGPTSGVPGTSYSYSTSAIDPIGDRIKYTVDWGDGGISETGFVNSGTTVFMPHIWFNSGTYQVKAKATDTGGRFSGWSAPINVTISAG